INFEYLPKQTISKRGVKTVWVSCGNKEKARATAMLLAYWEGAKITPFLIFKCAPSKIPETRLENATLRHGFSKTIIVKKKKNLEFHFAVRPNRDDNSLLIWYDFSGHWTPDVQAYAASINVILLKVPPRYKYVCQPADISWNKPLKAGLRALWVNRLRRQLV
ncbi:hypothetical protein L916_17156, partial [Phytophthora nicotianae]